MTTSNWNQAIIEEFRANEGRVEAFSGANMIVLHHVGRRSGEEYLAPVVFFTPAQLRTGDATEPMYVVGSAAGAPKDPQWVANLVTAGRATVEVGTETFEVGVENLEGAEHVRLLDAIKRVSPGFADYETKIAGARVMPVLALRRDG